MAIGPIDYTMQVRDPIEMALAGYAQRLDQSNALRRMGQQDRALDMQGQQIGLEAQRIDLARQAMQREEAARMRQQAGEAAFAEFALDPDKTYDKARAVVQANPQLAQAVMQTWEGMNEQRRNETKGFAMQFGYALQNSPDLAKQMLLDRAAAARNAGNTPEADALDSQAKMIDAGPEGIDALKAMTMASLVSVLPPAEAKTYMENVGMAGAKPATAKEAAEIDKIRAETAKINAELAGTGATKPGDAFDMEQKLRKEYTNLTGDFTGVREAYRRVNASDDSAAGDLSLIFGYMKMLDPASVVRETEFANAQNATGVPEQVRNMWNKLLTGERLGEKQRVEFKKQAEGLMTAARLREAEVRKGLMPSVTQYQLDPARVFAIGGDVGEQMTPPPSGRAESAAPTSAPSGSGQSTMQSARAKIGEAYRAKGSPLTPDELRQLLTPEEFDAVMNEARRGGQ